MEPAGTSMQALDTFLQQATDSGMVPGAVICVASRGQVVWHRAYGAAALTPEYRPMQCDTLFDIASLTQVVATTSLLLLAHHEGLCRLDDSLQHFYLIAHSVCCHRNVSLADPCAGRRSA